MSDHHRYSADSISWEQGSEKYRRNPARFLGSQDILGIRNQFIEILDNSIDETIRYHADNKLTAPLPVNITITEDEEVTIEDFGQGIPCEVSKKYGVPAIYPICESDSAGGKSRGTEGYDNIQTAGVHGAGLAVSIACTEYCILDVDSVSANGKFLLKYDKGRRAGELQRVGDLVLKSPEEQRSIGVSREDRPDAYMKGGTKITYKYDTEVFKMTLNGMNTNEAFSLRELEEKITNALMGSDGQFYVNLKFKDRPLRVFRYEDAKPEMVFDTQGRICVLEASSDKVQPFRTRLYLQTNIDYSNTKTKTIVNRLNITTSTSTEIMRDCMMKVLLKYWNMIRNSNPEYRSIRPNKKALQLYVSSVEIMHLTSGTFDGQTKQRLVSTEYIPYYRNELEKEMSKSKTFYELIIEPIITAEITRYKKDQEFKKAMEASKRKEERDKKRSEQQKTVEKLLENKKLRVQGKVKSKITIKDTPFRVEESTLVYVEGESAGSVFNNLHDEGEIPVAIALAKGNMPNVTDEGKRSSEVTMDNIVYCLKAGYKDIAIFTDADSDGLHIKILHLMQILTFAERYLKEGKVYLVPAPYSKLYLRKPLVLDLYGERKIYTVGETYAYSAKEHQSLVTAGAHVIKKFTGLADSDLSPNYLLKNRDNWIQLKNITEYDKKALHIVLSSKSRGYRRSFTSETFSERQFREKYVFSSRKSIGIETNEYYRLLDKVNLTTTADFSDYQNFITNDVMEKVKALKKKEMEK